MKNIVYRILCIVSIFCVSPAVASAAETLSVTDMAGRRVIVPFDPERIIAIGPGALRLIVYLQAESKVVGVESMEKMNPGGRPYWIAHPELAGLPSCGPGGPAGINKKPDMEAVLSVRPQVVFAAYMDAGLADRVQQSLNIPVVVLSYGEFAVFDKAIYDALRIAGKIVNREKRADDVVHYIESLHEDMRARTSDIDRASRPLVYVGGIGYRGAQGIESTERHYVPFEWIGVNNAAAQVKQGVGSHVAMDKELLLQLNPDVIFIDGGGLSLVAEDYRKRPEFFNALKAFSDRRVYTLLPFNWYATNIETVLADTYVIGKILYKKRFSDIDPVARAEEIYTFLLGKSVYKNMEDEYGPNGQMPFFLD